MHSTEPGGARRLGCIAKTSVWLFVVFATVAVGFYQRVTGPTYPLRVDTEIEGAHVKGKLPRTHPGEGGPTILLNVDDPSVEGSIGWRRYPLDEAIRVLPMARKDGVLTAELPHFPPAAKIAYNVTLKKGGRQAGVLDHPAVLRYRGDVPSALVIAHVLLMFMGLLFGFRVTVAAVFNEPEPRRWFRWLAPSLLLGGFVFGPAMSWYSFGEIWTGWPLGSDLTDTKTLGTALVWLVAWWIAARKPSLGRTAIVVAALAMLAAYLVPHSVAGSELDWKAGAAQSSSH